MASASLWLASFVPAYSSGVSVGIKRCNCSNVVMRCLSCQCQLFQSESETSCQKPRPAEWNCLRSWSRRSEGGSSTPGDVVSLCIWLAHYKFELRPVKLTAFL